jgi:hypothetical protein
LINLLALVVALGMRNIQPPTRDIGTARALHGEA